MFHIRRELHTFVPTIVFVWNRVTSDTFISAPPASLHPVAIRFLSQNAGIILGQALADLHDSGLEIQDFVPYPVTKMLETAYSGMALDGSQFYRPRVANLRLCLTFQRNIASIVRRNDLTVEEMAALVRPLGEDLIFPAGLASMQSLFRDAIHPGLVPHVGLIIWKMVDFWSVMLRTFTSLDDSSLADQVIDSEFIGAVASWCTSDRCSQGSRTSQAIIRSTSLFASLRWSSILRSFFA